MSGTGGDDALHRLSGAERALALAETVPQVLAVKSVAETARVYAKQSRLSLETTNQACLVRLHAEAKAAELLDQMRDRGELAKQGTNRQTLQPAMSRLADLAIEPTEAHRWSQVARSSAEERKAYAREATTAGDEVTRTGLAQWLARGGSAAAEERPWSDRERELLGRLEAGETVVVSYRTDANLIDRAESEGLFVRIDRRSDWGNPFLMDDEGEMLDGDRATVIARYEEHYLPFKPSLLNRLGDLKAKALGCWCDPDPCHGHVLKRWAEEGHDG